MLIWLHSQNLKILSANNNVAAVFEDNGSAELYEAGSKKLETTSIGTAITGSVVVSGGTNQSPIQSTTSNDFVGKFESSDSHARLIVQDRNSTANHNALKVEGNKADLMFEEMLNKLED